VSVPDLIWIRADALESQRRLARAMLRTFERLANSATARIDAAWWARSYGRRVKKVFGHESREPGGPRHGRVARTVRVRRQVGVARGAGENSRGQRRHAAEDCGVERPKEKTAPPAKPGRRPMIVSIEYPQ